MKNKGQALVEFIIILPVLLLLILGAIDFGNILYKEYSLENDLDYVVELIRQNKTTEIDYYVKQKGITSLVMNKKGQVLVVFLILLPILLLLVGLIIDVGLAYNEKRKMNHVIEDTISYALDHITEEQDTLKINMNYFLKENLKDLDTIKIEIKNETIIIEIKKRMDTIFLPKDYQIKSSYEGSFVNGKKRIKRKG